MNKKTPASTPEEGGSGSVVGAVIGTGAGCGIVTMVLVLLWLGVSAYVAHEASRANPIQGTTNGGSFVLWFVYWSVIYLIFLIPALPCDWLICGVIGWDYARRPNFWQEVWRLSLSLSAGGVAGGVLVWVVVSFITRDPLWFLQML